MEHDDLEALFEATRAEAERAATAPAVPVPVAAPAVAGKQVALDESFPDTVVVTGAPGHCPNADADGTCRDCRCGSARDLRDRVGRLTRELHESLQELRLDRTLADMAVEIPDARNRLKYVTEMCERSAQKVLDTLDELSPLQEANRDESVALLARWDRMLTDKRRPDEGFMALFETTRAHLAATVERADRTSSLHSDIMMAQDFQDLTGQVCRKIEGITERIETQLLKLLIDTAPEDHRQRHQEMLEGPQVVTGRSDAVTSQTEVDDLLSSLGF
ncbi:MAG: protein phosphatase CheZ [Burkholderiaceae bacterium]|jgi:chemotaxis protein CheZ|nr:protein phosphatase CheZ [Burkholderiales bacterium]MCZ8338481.1 protein phosphatase CheZ [Burkholderiaceae bacterium]